MNRLLLSAVLAATLCGGAVRAADVIKPGTHFFDGRVLYEAEQRYGSGNICLVGADAGGDVHELFLDGYSNAEDQGLYWLSPTSVTHEAPYGVDWGARVHVTAIAGTHVINVLTEGDTCDWVAATLVQTPNSLTYCLEQQQWAEHQPLVDLASGWLMNHDLVSAWDTSELVKQARAMDGKALTDLESINYSLIQAEIARRWRTGLALNDPEAAPGVTLPEPCPVGTTLANLPRYTVHDAVEFIRALGSDREIVVEKGVEINLSRVLDNFDYFNKPGFKMDNYLVASHVASTTDEPIVMSEFCSDGSQLSLINISNLYIHGRRGARIVVEPRRAFVMNLVGCNGINLSNLTMGHTEGGLCEGGVIGIAGSSSVTITDCDLYGCGTYGLDISDSEMVYVSGSNVHDCTYGIMELVRSSDIAFDECDFFRNKELDLVFAQHCDDVSFSDCRFFLNNRTSMLFSTNKEITLDNCFIYHPADKIGDSALVKQVNCWQLEGDEAGPPARGCGTK